MSELGVDRLPENLDLALTALEQDSLLAEALGERLITSFLKLKRQEWQDYHRSVSEWELQRYLTFY